MGNASCLHQECYEIDLRHRLAYCSCTVILHMQNAYFLSVRVSEQHQTSQLHHLLYLPVPTHGHDMSSLSPSSALSLESLHVRRTCCSHPKQAEIFSSLNIQKHDHRTQHYSSLPLL